ncbi:tetratricopeptide repeat protein [Actinophytocola sediminis]
MCAVPPTTNLSGTTPLGSTTPRDPVAVVLGNASLFGVGYLLLGRRLLGVACALISIALLGVLGGVTHAGWVQWLLLFWWAGMIGHGWRTASRPPKAVIPWQRVCAGVLGVVVLGAFVIVRLDLNGRADEADAAHAHGDCERTSSIADDVGFWQRIGNGPVADGILDAVEACRLIQRARVQARTDRLQAAETMASYERRPDARWTDARRYREDLLLDQARDDLRAGLADAYQLAMEKGFALIATLRAEFPNRQEDTDKVLDEFLAGLPTDDACRTVDVTDWIVKQDAETDDLDRARTVAAKVTPLALLTCADTQLAANNPTEARAGYQQLLDTYPNDPGVTRAKRGHTLATWAIQLIEVRALVQTTYANEMPAYCTNPRPYGAARPYTGHGTFPAMVFGQDAHRKGLPKNWQANDPKNATLIICAGEVTYGAVAQTCTYYKNAGFGEGVLVSFHQQKIPVRVYEVRTGRKLADFGLQIDGAACRPEYLDYTFPVGADTGPGPQYVESSTEDIRAAYQTMIIR